MSIDPKTVKFDERGLVPAIVQDARTREVLTLAYMNEESLARTLETGQTWFWSRSRNELWHKGETSGNTQHVVSVTADCDHDALVVLVEPAGPACHTGARSCFDLELSDEQSHDGLFQELYEVIKTRQRERPDGSYTTYLFDKGLDKILKKVGEESAETIIAAKNDDPKQLVSETADLLYHLLVMLVARDVSLDEVRAELAQRRKTGVASAAE
ncbi:MAG TPA: bifunctional phosphoribosyl-AMP cyclohydrolase/phosphoribosyl-ATP diphosphatase HisIE [Pyrinomonadaceae bacterium]|nr:bifunctional phosphoribosyl-AMP cyclohydrolase/phosphoribosyl-ATP diphosphatase HisIE [Pyrinomonadaceae bacterium]